jgi:hypothetical protein
VGVVAAGLTRSQQDPARRRLIRGQGETIACLISVHPLDQLAEGAQEVVDLLQAPSRLAFGFDHPALAVLRREDVDPALAPPTTLIFGPPPKEAFYL